MRPTPAARPGSTPPSRRIQQLLPVARSKSVPIFTRPRRFTKTAVEVGRGLLAELPPLGPARLRDRRARAAAGRRSTSSTRNTPAPSPERRWSVTWSATASTRCSSPAARQALACGHGDRREELSTEADHHPRRGAGSLGDRARVDTVRHPGPFRRRCQPGGDAGLSAASIKWFHLLGWICLLNSAGGTRLLLFPFG